MAAIDRVIIQLERNRLTGINLELEIGFPVSVHNDCFASSRTFPCVFNAVVLNPVFLIVSIRLGFIGKRKTRCCRKGNVGNENE